MRICSGAGCLRVVRNDVRYCDECKPAPPVVDDGIRTHHSSYDAELDRLRKSPRWQRIRKSVVQRQPLCARCEAHYTEIVDHIVPAQIAIAQCQAASFSLDKFAGYFLVTNLQGLCRPCHGRKTVEDKAHQGAWPDVVARERAAPKKVYSF
jgi:5-methylcytosine-specific restriction protein A